jgi:hypothetical protein
MLLRALFATGGGAATEIQPSWSPKTRFAVMEEGGLQKGWISGQACAKSSRESATRILNPTTKPLP